MIELQIYKKILILSLFLEINGKLSFAVCIMILKELGFTDISFRKEYLKLSILNH